MTLKYPAPLTLLQADQYAREVVAEAGPDHTYSLRETADGKGCLYVHNGEPDCIVARIMRRHGVPIEVLAQWENVGARDMCHLNEIAVRPIQFKRRELPALGLATGAAAEFLGHLQASQDSRIPWGEALERATRMARTAAHVTATTSLEGMNA
jgi:hypothetical protein